MTYLEKHQKLWKEMEDAVDNLRRANSNIAKLDKEVGKALGVDFDKNVAKGYSFYVNLNKKEIYGAPKNFCDAKEYEVDSYEVGKWAIEVTYYTDTPLTDLKKYFTKFIRGL